MKDYGLVSVITPTWNCGRFIAETIESVLAQTYPNWEMLIVDDCSTDDTKEVVARYANDSRVKYQCLDRNSGAAVARNTALRLAKGRWVAFLDSDDLWRRDKLEHQLAFMVEKGVPFSYHKYSEIDEDSELLGVVVGGKKVVHRWEMFSCCWPGCLAVMYDVAVMGIIQIENVKKDNDSAIWLKAVKKSPCYFLNENLALYRRRKGSITPTSILDKIKWHYTLFRKAEHMNPLFASFWMCANIVGNAYKKAFYVKRV